MEPARRGGVTAAVDYGAFVARKLTRQPPTGLAVVPPLAKHLFAHQATLTSWSLRLGRSLVGANTGLGKTAIDLEWSRHVAAHTGRPVLILAPLAVGAQIVEEGARFGVACTPARDQSDVCDGINVTNYERLHLFESAAFGGVVCDESGIIKHHDSKTFGALCRAFRDTAFKLCTTATPAPNDWTELGTHAEFLGVCTRAEMLAEYFVHDGGETQSWRLKKHARAAFWRWVATWGALVRHPRDLGFEVAGYDLPPLALHEHVVACDDRDAQAGGMLFAMPARTLSEQRAAKRASLNKRVAKAAALIAAEPDEPWLVFCELNDEANALERAVPGAVQVAGCDTLEDKESRLLGFARGGYRVLVSKAKLCGFGLNFQRCARVLFVGVTHSYESFFQSTRRCYRFGQPRPVHVHVVCGDLETEVMASLRRKEEAFAAMGEALSADVAAAVRAEVRGTERQTNAYAPAVPLRVPDWLRTDEEAA